MIRIYTLKDNIKFSSEQIILFGILDNYNSLTIEPHNYNFKGESNTIILLKHVINYLFM